MRNILVRVSLCGAQNVTLSALELNIKYFYLDILTYIFRLPILELPVKTKRFFFSFAVVDLSKVGDAFVVVATVVDDKTEIKN